VSSQSPTSLTLSWAASTDDVGVTGYDVYLGGTLVTVTTSTSYAFSGLTCATSYALSVDAYDAAGNKSTQASLSASTAACGDTSPPSAPTGLAVSGQSTTSLTLGWTASSDNVGVTGYHVYLGGVLITTTTGTSYAFSGLTCATSYTLAVDAYDAAGNESNQASLSSTTAACSTTVGTSLPSSLAASTGTTYYVSTTGSDANPGTYALPWRTIQKALNTLQAGQTAVVMGGTYAGNLVFSRSGTASAPITVTANPGDTVVLHAASASGDGVDWYPLQITGSYFRLRGFVIENGFGTSDANVYLWGGANHVELSGNEIRYGQDQGIFADNTTSYLYLLDNKIHDNGWNHLSTQHQSHGIYIEGGNDLIANNQVYNHPYGFGMQIYPANHDSVVVDNTVAASGHSSIVVGGSGGVYNLTIRNNILYGGDYGIDHDTCPTGAVTIDHNLIYAYNVASVRGGCSNENTSAGNILADPMFANYANRDLHILSGSPADNQASGPWSETNDYAGTVRPEGAGPDIGAYER
jgi:chitodextrinase